MSTTIWWIRRDLRLSDNQALTAALQLGGQVIPVFILDPQLLASGYVGQKRLAFLFAGLRILDASLRQRGSALIVRRGDPLEQLQLLCAETGAERIYAEADYSPYARRRDKRAAANLPLTLFSGLTVHPPEVLLKVDGTPYKVFTPFSLFWRSLPFPGSPLPAPDRLPALPPLTSLEIPHQPALPEEVPFLPGEAEAQRRLSLFAKNAITLYADERNRMDLGSTSELSPYLRFGMLSARQAAFAALEAADRARAGDQQRSAESWLNELVWREFYVAILYHFPSVRHQDFHAIHAAGHPRDKPPSRGYPSWRDDPAGFAAWAEGRTGYPVVDAAMRQLHTTGWMHNRARMIVASFLTKDLLVDWRLGERHFMQHLIDGDPASNNGGWQWTAGTGADAAPYYRVFNPVLQGMKFDPHGAYVRRWLPALAAVPEGYIHSPWLMPVDVQTRSGCIIGKDYPAPILDHAAARERALSIY
jgi:deoxyribodipyrimidine photo-lyase